ncbi:MAG: hypothetical protein LBG95_06990 [Treponema sp.]|jgi:hypothetical protein|nr:hypothetical protein [Treponema sp.]
MNEKISIQELNDYWPDGIFTIEEAADNLKDEDIFQGYPANIWKEAAAHIREYQAGKISGKDIEKWQQQLFSEENMIEAIKEERPEVQDNLKQLSHILETGESQIIQNEKLGNISIDKGRTGKDGYGLLRIIENRTKEGRDDEETSAIIHLVSQAAEKGNITRNITEKDTPEKVRRVEIEKNGIIALISLHRKQDQEKWILTGFDNRNKKEEAAEAMQTVIAQYGRTPEFSYFRKQVGAAVSSLQVSRQPHDKSSEIETARKAGYVQGVCECAAAVGDHRALGKKLLTEMNVTKDMAKKYASPETFKALEEGIFAPKTERNQEQTHNIKR